MTDKDKEFLKFFLIVSLAHLLPIAIVLMIVYL